jgi:hypothetical protein
MYVRRVPWHRPPEDPGSFACPPIAGLVAAGGQQLLAMVHQLVADHGGIVAACDTDGAHIVSTREGGTIYVETRGGDFYEGGSAEPVYALSWAEVEGIAARFEPLNSFDRALLPGSPLRLQRVNFDPDGRQIPLEGHFISAKRHSLVRSDGSFADYKESILASGRNRVQPAIGRYLIISTPPKPWRVGGHPQLRRRHWLQGSVAR